MNTKNEVGNNKDTEFAKWYLKNTVLRERNEYMEFIYYKAVKNNNVELVKICLKNNIPWCKRFIFYSYISRTY